MTDDLSAWAMSRRPYREMLQGVRCRDGSWIFTARQGDCDSVRMYHVAVDGWRRVTARILHAERRRMRT